MIYDLLLIRDSTNSDKGIHALIPADGVTLEPVQGTSSFAANLVSVYDAPAPKKKGRWTYEIPKKYLVPFQMMGQFCDTCNTVTAFRYWHTGVMHPAKAELECMICKISIYIEG